MNKLRRFTENVADGQKGRVAYATSTAALAKWLPGMIWDYYKLSGRHERTGRPFKDTLEKLDLQEFQEWSQLD